MINPNDIDNKSDEELQEILTPEMLEEFSNNKGEEEDE